jgi:hypothetical protein
MMEMYPISCKKFCDWIDSYKAATNWDKLFNHGVIHYVPGSAFKSTTSAPKFHELPHAFQLGLWHTYALQLENSEWYIEELYSSNYESLQKAIEAFFEYSESWEPGKRCEHCGMVINDCICDDNTHK